MLREAANAQKKLKLSVSSSNKSHDDHITGLKKTKSTVVSCCLLSKRQNRLERTEYVELVLHNNTTYSEVIEKG
jgi:hypothetical protein